MEIGIDIGGTFTDIVMVADGRMRMAKLPSVPGSPDLAFRRALLHAAKAWSIELAQLDRLVHGTTVGTNMLIERSARPVGLLTTAGFRDVLDLGRQNRSDLYSLIIKPADWSWLCPRDLRMEVTERIDRNGQVVTALDEAAVIEGVERLLAQDVSAIAVCFLFSFANPDHENAAAELIRARWPDLPVSLSSVVDPQLREFERTLTTLVDAYLKPGVANYVRRLEAAAAELGIRCPIEIARSRGAVADIQTVTQTPIELALSGPAAAVAGAAAEVRGSEIRNVITIDIGGTSADIALVRDGKVLLRHDGAMGDLQLRCTMVDVSAIGAGGGSIAETGAGTLRVGPRSAGADPGPVAYGRGGVEPTITDASLVLGYIAAEGFPGSDLHFDADSARRAIDGRIARPLGMDVETAALGMHMVLNARMAEAIRLITVKRGIDPRTCALMPLGGGGGLHATALARMVGIRTIVAPPCPGVMAAWGLLRCPAEQSATQAVDAGLNAMTSDAIAAIIERLRAKLEAQPAAAATQAPPRELVVLQLCFQGQSSDLPIELDEAAWRGISPEAIASAFATRYRTLFGHLPSAPIVLRRVEVIFSREAPPSRQMAEAGPQRPIGQRMLHLPGTVQRVPAAVLSRAQLRKQPIFGPLIVEQADCTLLFDAGWRVGCEDNGLLIAQRVAGRDGEAEQAA